MAKQKILIVDDDNNIAELISLYLMKECFDTMIVEDGEKALEQFGQFQPNLILLDLMLPGTLNTSIKSGFSLAQIGEFAFIIAGLGVSLKVLDPFISPIIVAVSVITTFTTPYFIRLANPFAEWLYKILPTKVQETLDRYASGKKTMNHDSDWKKLLKNMIGRVVIYSVLLTAIKSGKTRRAA